jgi:hypothetical protein
MSSGPKLRGHVRPTALLVVASVALSASAPPAVATFGASTARAVTAKKKKTKKTATKTKAPLTATVNGTFTVRQDDPNGFGNDEGPNWQQLNVVIEDAKVPFRGPNRQSASADVDVRVGYEAQAHTMDRSWAIGCDREDRQTLSKWTEKMSVTVRETSWLQTAGTSKKYYGWQVFATLPTAFDFQVSTGSWQEWDSIQMDTCITVAANRPLGSWGLGWATPDGLGKLTSDGRAVPLTAINTDVNQTGSATGSVTFNQSVHR